MTDLVSRLQALSFTALADGWDDVVALVTTKRWSFTQRPSSTSSRSRKRSGLDEVSSGDSAVPGSSVSSPWPTSTGTGPIRSIALWSSLLSVSTSCRPNATSCSLQLKAQGLGKTMIAQNIAHHAILSGHTALFITASDLLLDLGKQESARALERRIRYYAGITLLVVDEIGFLAFDNRNADLLFQIVSRRYEKKSLVLTTNLLFRDWSTISHLSQRHVCHRTRRAHRPPRRRDQHPGQELSRPRSRARHQRTRSASQEAKVSAGPLTKTIPLICSIIPRPGSPPGRSFPSACSRVPLPGCSNSCAFE